MALAFFAHPSSGLETANIGGVDRVFACLPSDFTAHGPLMKAHPKTYEDIFGDIPRSEWPQSYSLRHLFPFMWNQGSQGSCGGHGGAACAVARWNGQGKTQREFSPTYLYGLVNRGQDNGSTPEDLDVAMRTHGLCLRSTVGPGKIHPPFSPQAAEESKRFKIEQTYRVTTIEGMVSALLREHPLFNGIWCGNNFDPDSQGYLPEYRGGGGGHCMANLGYVIRNGRIYLEKPNSWGNGWGAGGWCYEPQSYAEAGFRSFACFAVVACGEDPLDVIHAHG
jgi:hypothetical protein